MMNFECLASVVTETDDVTGRVMLRAMPVMVTVLCLVAIAYRYYSRFLARRVAQLDDRRETPAHQFEDGQNFHPTNRWVLFGHHFAAISGAGPLIGPVLAMQYGYAPGLMWLVIGVCLAGAVQDMLVMAASVRRGGVSLAEIARAELGPTASIIASMAILFIVVIALAGLAFVVVKALGGEEAKLAAGTRIVVPKNASIDGQNLDGRLIVSFPPKCGILYANESRASPRPEAFRVAMPTGTELAALSATIPEDAPGLIGGGYVTQQFPSQIVSLPAGCKQIIPGSSWGAFTIACTIPIALFVGLWMYRIRKGRIVEASVIGAVMVLAAVVGGEQIRGSSLESIFSLSRDQTIWALGIYGFIAAVLPVWLLLTPRDYLSSFMKIGTLILLVVGVILANPTLQHEPLNPSFRAGGPTFPGGLFPFVFICVMCGAISGFHSLVASGTTPKMIDKESDIRPIGYGAMLLEGLVGVVALIAAASMPPNLYFDINTDVEKAPLFQKQLREMQERLQTSPGATERTHRIGVSELHQLDIAKAEELVGGESLRGRTGGAVTLAVSMATILTDAFNWLDSNLRDLMKYWYHFAIMFEALFILTTIDAGTRIARYLFQETLGKIHPQFAKTNWLPGAILATAMVTFGWGLLVSTGKIETIWPMFGIANQLLSVMALALVTTVLVNSGRAKYAWVTALPMIFVSITTLSAGRIMVGIQYERITKNIDPTTNGINMGLTLFVIMSVCSLVCIAMARWVVCWRTGWKGA